MRDLRGTIGSIFSPGVQPVSGVGYERKQNQRYNMTFEIHLERKMGRKALQGYETNAGKCV